MKPVYFSIDRGIVTHPDQWIKTKLQIEKAFITMRHLDRSMYGGFYTNISNYQLYVFQMLAYCHI